MVAPGSRTEFKEIVLQALCGDVREALQIFLERDPFVEPREKFPIGVTRSFGITFGGQKLQAVVGFGSQLESEFTQLRRLFFFRDAELFLELFLDGIFSLGGPVA